MRQLRCMGGWACLLAGVLVRAAAAPPSDAATAQDARSGDDLIVGSSEESRPGGRLTVALRSEPRTLNPITAVDGASREVIGRMTGDLIHINRQTLGTEPALAKSWTVTDGGRKYVLHLRRGLRFSDGRPCDADDVVFSFETYLDERSRSPNRDLLVVGSSPITVRKVDPLTVSVEMKEPYAVAERLFDSVAILPRHILARARQEGRIDQVWGLGAAPSEIAGLGPFRLKAYLPGQRLVLERNPYYWKKDRAGRRLPYLEELTFLFVGSEDAQVIRFQAGETDVISRMSAENFAVLEKDQAARGYRLHDLGPSLEYTFVVFNLNDVAGKALPRVARRQEWFNNLAFRRAVSAAVDRDGIVRLAYRGRAAPLAAHVTPGNKPWVNTSIPRPRRSLAEARRLLAGAGFSWKSDGTLVDSRGEAVEFSILTSAGNAPRNQTATIVQDDLRQLGMQVHVVSLEQRALVDRVLQSFDYDAAVMALGSTDADPNPEMNVWMSGGKTHLWRLGQVQPATAWEAEIDDLLRRQLVAAPYENRKRLYDRVQQLVAENLPLVCLVSPNALVGGRDGLVNFRPAVLEHQTLWNADELAWRTPAKP